MEKPTSKLHFSRPPSHRECATILAALRIFQSILGAGANPALEDDADGVLEYTATDLRNMEHFEDFERYGDKMLTIEELDNLCEAINLHKIKKGRNG